MENTELIKALRCGGHNMIFHYCDKVDCQYCQYSYYENLHICNVKELGIDAADALEADEQRIEKLEAQIPKEAHWVAVQNGMGICSNCNRQDRIDNLATHCRYCGARMRKGGERSENNSTMKDIKDGYGLKPIITDGKNGLLHIE